MATCERHYSQGLRNNWGIYRPSHDIGVGRTLGLFNRAGEAIEVGFVHRESNEPIYNPYPPEVRAVGAITIAAAELGQVDQGWAASAGLREIWDWKHGIPEERSGSWQRAIARQIMDVATSIPAADMGAPTQPYFVDLARGKELKAERAARMGLAA